MRCSPSDPDRGSARGGAAADRGRRPPASGGADDPSLGFERFLSIFLISSSLQFSGSVDAAFSRPGLQLQPAWYGAAVNDGRKATGVAGAQRR